MGVFARVPEIANNFTNKHLCKSHIFEKVMSSSLKYILDHSYFGYIIVCAYGKQW